MKDVTPPRTSFRIVTASARSVAARWKRQWGDSPRVPPDNARIIAQLEAIRPEDMTVAMADKIIGNQSWTTPFCGSCNEYRSPVVAFGQDYPSHVCLTCLVEALRALRKQDVIDAMRMPRIAP